MLAGPIRGELLGAEHLAERALVLARSQRILGRGKGKRLTPLLARLNATRAILNDAHERLASAVEREIDVGPAGEWFLDNFYVLQEHILEVRESLPRGYYRELPELATGALTGYPRVYETAITLISHTEGRVDLENVNLFISAFQQSVALSIGELWAVPAMLRLGLIENVRRMTLRTVERLDEVERADQWAARIQAASELGSRELNQVLDEFVSGPPALTATFVSRFLQRLRLAPGSLPSLVWLERWIGDEGLNAEEAAARSTQRLALTQLMMANSITSLRAIARMDWRSFVERQSIVEAVLRDDPAGFYSRMTFASRDQYRHVVERIAKWTDQAEETVARASIELARARMAGDGSQVSEAHVGYFLIDAGLAQLERTTGYRPTLGESVHRWVHRHPNTVFVGGILAGTAIALAALFWLAGPRAGAAVFTILVFALLPASDIAVNVMSQLVTAFLPPRILAKLDLGAQGVPSEFRTAVVIPTLFSGVEAVREALENLEAQFLANRESYLHFALLSDLTDAPAETMDEDAAILQAAVDGVRALNARYGQGAQDAFYLFHRPRRWNERQGVWMGWERKRGKLAEFNRFLRGGAAGSFSVIEGDVVPLQGVRYVITLDADTVLPPDAAPLLIGALAHPLNRPVYDPAKKRVVRGYGILQPRVGVSLPSAHRSRFATIHSGHPGLDPYTTAVSDVYQDLYGEGSFTGKGIYDVDAFEQATEGRFPENTLLSHDLIEGSYARAGLATDITVYDDYPAQYLTFTRRKHRWIRGDWQLLHWLGPKVPGPQGPERNRLSLLSQWRILDNMRRSTVEISHLCFLVAGWTLLPGSPLRWTILSLAAVAAPWIVSLLLAVLRPPLDKSWRAYYTAVGRDAVTSMQQVGLTLIFLPHQAWVSADAILRTLWRVYVSQRRLLEWEAASQTERGHSRSVEETWRAMSPAVGIAILLLLVGLPLGSTAADRSLLELLGAAFPLVSLWAVSPAVALSLGRPAVRLERRLPPSIRAAALRYALPHWRFFDQFVTAETNWLVPDNFQEEPFPVVAMRTSPSNLGLQLLATVSAYDLGFITVEDMTGRLERAFRSLERMRRFHGHFYNWYDLRDLQVLEPAYISTVDSGNLAGHLLALRQACLAIPNDSVFDARVWPALEAGLTLAHQQLRELADGEYAGQPASRRAAGAILKQLRETRASLAEARTAKSPPDLLDKANDSLGRIREALGRLPLASTGPGAVTEWVDWSSALTALHRTRLIDLSPRMATGRGDDLTVVYPTLRELTDPAAADVIARLEALAERAYDYAREMDFRFLFDSGRKLFVIGYQQSSHSRDTSHYDLLASEARLASFVAIAKNDVPVEHWFRLGRTLTRAAGETALVSWGGSMFEYLMPALVMQWFPFTVLDQTYRGAVERQIAHGIEHGVPWGVSEGAYNLRDRHFTYQYRAFGVPDLALRRGLGRDLVIAPYASALAVMVDPPNALANLAAIERRGAFGPFGFRDALDYTRPDPGRRYAVVRTYMAHHIGMGLVALTNALTAQVWQRRFHADPMVRSAELLLHERIPRRLVLQGVQMARADEALPDPELERPAVREIDIPDTPQPHVALIGYLPYTIMVTSSGSGYSRFEQLAVTRWRADGTRDHTGQFCYLKDIAGGQVWSAAHQPVVAKADWYRALLATDRVTFHRADGAIETRTEITVVPADSAEVRRITVTNNGETPREIELTSYGEIVLAPPDTDRAHPAFSNLFVETEWHEWCTAITAARRPRSALEPPLWCVHVVDRGKRQVGAVTCETDRARFLGRGRSTRDPVAMEADGPLSGTTGAVLDPIFALRTRVLLQPGQSASVAFTTLVASTRERAFELAGRYHDPHAAQRALDLAWTSTQVELRELGITPADAAVFQELAGHLFFSNPLLRAPQSELSRNTASQASLWANGISGDWPILLATMDSPEGLPTLRQLFQAHHYWRRRGMVVDLLVLNTQPSAYLQELSEQISAAMLASSDSGLADRPGGVFIRQRDRLRPEELLMLRATSRVHIACDGRSLGRILDSLMETEGTAVPELEPPPPMPRFSARSAAAAAARAIWRIWSDSPASLPPKPPDPRRTPSRAGTRLPVMTREGAARPLLFENGFGGMTPEGAYEIRVRGDAVPPAPWANVIANSYGGFIVTERGAGCSWAGNSLFYRLTPWHNDPISDPPGEVIYLQDAESGELWSPTPAPIWSDAPYTVRHTAGSSSFVHESGGIATRLTLGLAEDEMVKLTVLRLTNRDARPRSLVLTAYVEWTLGMLREHTQHQVRTEFDPRLGAILAQNFFNPEFADRVAFCAVTAPVAAYTADRREFLGRNGDAADPAALRGATLSGTTGAGIDPCAALQCLIMLAPGETREVAVILGAVVGSTRAREAVARYRSVEQATRAATGTVEGWERRLSVIAVHTPEPAFDAMVNRWSLYQALACRMWGRSALYQSSGAYGFRDQLQDVMAFVYAEPSIAREHILRSASRQFLEGDVQHWWHPHSGRGIRTRFSDDLLWLPYVVDHYVQVTGDTGVLEENVPFLSMRLLEPQEHEVYDLPQVAGEGSVYQHCVQALRRACTVGTHGLPLIGTGDWNDGMNRVGVEGRGESVWLGWFLVATLRAFAEHAVTRGDAAAAIDFRARANGYAAAIEAEGWDGEWYRRAYFDDGTPLGAAQSDECRIDSIAQSWSVISGAGDPERQSRAMRSLEKHLVREDARLLPLLAPPFDKTPTDPGYIKGYLPGVRENGAQYTHAALWAVLAAALRGDADRAFEWFQMINPLTHARTVEEVEVYQVEPYVVAADVYTANGHVGRGGWTWYTGSASWMYRVALEGLLGFTKRGDRLFIDPCVPTSWPEYTIEYRYGRSLYRIVVRNPEGVSHGRALVSLDGHILDSPTIPLVDDARTHEVEIGPGPLPPT